MGGAYCVSPMNSPLDSPLFSILAHELQVYFLETFILGREPEAGHEVTNGREALDNMLTVRCLTRWCATAWREQAFTIAYRLIMQRRMALRAELTMNPDTVNPITTAFFTQSMQIVAQADSLLETQYLVMAKGNPEAALAGLRMHVQNSKIQEADLRKSVSDCAFLSLP